MKIQRTVPPAAAPIGMRSLIHGLAGIFFGKEYRRRLEDELRDYFDVKYIFLASSGKAALTIILRALRSLLPEKSRVLIPAYTCFSVPSSIVRAGLRVSLCDVDPQTLNFDHDLLESCAQKDTLCVIATHLFGLPSDMEKINNFGKRNGLFIVEDAAQAMGGKHGEKPLGSLGDVGFLSLGRGKNITCGSGGVIVTDSESIACEIEREQRQIDEMSIAEILKEFIKVLLMTIFLRPSLYWLPSGLPSLKLGETMYDVDFPIRKLSGMQAGLLAGWRRRLEESNAVRARNASSLTARLNLPRPLLTSVPYLRLPVLVKSREAREHIDALSLKEGLGISKMYPAPINQIDEIRGQFKEAEFPRASEVAERLRTLPTHQFVSEKDIETICRCFENEYDAFNTQQVMGRHKNCLNKCSS
ncbi:MAG TPA: aminotransferase DegT [Nitrospiraceae bacterium]|nr:aminotransferase DegT [Nitrospiraceae bacterium]